MKKKVAKILSPVLAAVMLIVVAQAVPASAHHLCWNGYACIHKDKNFAGGALNTKNYRDHLDEWNDVASSIENYGAESFWFSEDAKCGGWDLKVGPGGFVKDLSGWWFDKNEEISSIHRNKYYKDHAHC